MEHNNRSKTVIYVRVSSEEQSKHGVSIQNQIERAKAYCFAKDFEIHEVISDPGKSAKDLKRPGIQKLIKLCKRKKIQCVVVFKLDRLTRSLKDLNYLIYDVFLKHEIDFNSVQDSIDTGTANGRMLINLLGTISQWERETIGERTREALAYKRRNGKRTGEVPFGYDSDAKGVLRPNKREMIVLNRMKFLRKIGYSYNRIAEELQRENHACKKSNRWHPYTIQKILKRAA